MEQRLFEDLIDSDVSAHRTNQAKTWPVSIALHGLIAVAIIIVQQDHRAVRARRLQHIAALVDDDAAWRTQAIGPRPSAEPVGHARVGEPS